MFPAGPEQQAQDQSVPRRTSTASSGSKCSPPDLNRELRIRVFTSTTKNLRRYTRKNVRMNICQKAYQNRCHIECQKECLNICQKECQNKYAMCTSRWYVRKYVTIVFQSGDHSQKVFFQWMDVVETMFLFTTLTTSCRKVTGMIVVWECLGEVSPNV